MSTSTEWRYGSMDRCDAGLSADAISESLKAAVPTIQLPSWVLCVYAPYLGTNLC